MFVQEGLARHYKTGRAKAALLRVVFDKGGHDGMQFAILGKSFDRHDVMSFRLNGEQIARIDRFAIQNDCAGATDPAIAHFLGPGQVQMVPESIEQCDARFEIQFVTLTVNPQSDGHRPWSGDSIRLRWRGGGVRFRNQQSAGYGGASSLQKVAPGQTFFPRSDLIRLLPFSFHALLLRERNNMGEFRSRCMFFSNEAALSICQKNGQIIALFSRVRTMPSCVQQASLWPL